jgi:hypothetical protein
VYIITVRGKREEAEEENEKYVVDQGLSTETQPKQGTTEEETARLGEREKRKVKYLFV